VRPLAPSPAWTLVTPYCKRTRPGRGTNTKAAGFPPLSRPSPATSLPPFALGLAPTHLGWGTRRHFTRRPRDPPVSKRRQLARQVGACCVLTNSFPSSSRWAVTSNLSGPGRCSISGVLSSFPRRQLRHDTPSTAVRHQQWRPTAHPPVAESTTSSPRGGRTTFELTPSSPPPTEEEAGQPRPSRRQRLVGCRASRRRQRPNGGRVGHRPRV
jgi:hypothetical protein